jgi:hypothetical protein
MTTQTAQEQKECPEIVKSVPEADAHDRWFREQVREALDDPRPAIPHEQVKVAWTLKRKELMLRANGVKP